MMNVWLPTIRTQSGTDIFTIRLCEGLRSLGVNATISWFPHRYELAPWLLQAVQPPSGTNIIHANSWHGLAFHRPGIPLIVTVHHIVFDPEYCRMKTWPRWFYHELMVRLYEKMAFRKATAITAVSNFAASCATSFDRANRIECIYNWVDTHFFQPSNDMHSSDKFRLLFIGNPTQHKGADLLAPIMRELGNDFELYYTTQTMVSSIPKHNTNMHALGRLTQPEILRAYQQCDALLFPTRGEAAGYASIEAMACGKPVIASRNSALPEYVEDGKTGYLCETGNIDEFVQAIRKLKEDKGMALKMGRDGRERVVSHFSGEKSLKSYVELYRSITT